MDRGMTKIIADKAALGVVSAPQKGEKAVPGHQAVEVIEGNICKGENICINPEKNIGRAAFDSVKDTEHLMAKPYRLP